MEKTVYFPEIRGEQVHSMKKTLDTMLHAIRAKESGGEILEVSPYGNAVGKACTPWHLKMKADNGEEYPVAALYEAAKIFEDGGPYEDLRSKRPDEIFGDQRLRDAGSLMGFHFENEAFTTSPRHKFFDYLYIRALRDREDLHEALLKAEILTDVTYQMSRMYLSPARSVSYFISLYREGLLDKVLSSSEEFDHLYTLTFP